MFSLKSQLSMSYMSSWIWQRVSGSLFHHSYIMSYPTPDKFPFWWQIPVCFYHSHWAQKRHPPRTVPREPSWNWGTSEDPAMLKFMNWTWWFVLWFWPAVISRWIFYFSEEAWKCRGSLAVILPSNLAIHPHNPWVRLEICLYLVTRAQNPKLKTF